MGGALHLDRDRLVLVGMTMALITYLLVSFEYNREYPFLMAVLLLCSLSLILFFTFMPSITKTWYVRGIVVNIILIILLPFIEGMFFAIIAICMLAILGMVHVARYRLRK